MRKVLSPFVHLHKNPLRGLPTERQEGEVNLQEVLGEGGLKLEVVLVGGVVFSRGFVAIFSARHCERNVVSDGAI